MKLPNWETQFRPLSNQGWGIRQGQQELADAFINAINNKTSLIGEAGTGTGKSFVAIIPVIHAIQSAKKENKVYRAVISTETITLQNQIVNKDLPMLEKVYGYFNYKKLMGRSNYVCMDAAHLQTVGDLKLNNLFMRLEGAGSRLTTGERSDVEAVLGTTLSNDEWDALTGSSEFCIDNKCTDTKRCFSTRARKQALSADVVVCNHAILATDVDLKVTAPALVESDGLLGAYNTLIVDEGHRLVPVFASHFAEKINGYEIDQMTGDLLTGADELKNAVKIKGRELNDTMEDLRKIMDLALQYYSQGVEDWDRAEFPLTYRMFSSASSSFIDVMTAFETTTVGRLANIIVVLEDFKKTAEKALKSIEEQGKGSKWAKSRKAYRKAIKLIEICTIIRDSLLSTDGIVNSYGMYGAVINGYTSRDGTKRCSITLEPLDLSPQIKYLWSGANTSLLMSATLSDPTHNNPYQFIQTSTGFPHSPVVRVDSPFNAKTQQLVYITKANKQPVENSRYSFEELYESLLKAKGRSLVLFTARSELDEAALKLRIKHSKGEFPYRVLVQERDSDKKRLAEEFKRDTHSVLLGTDSFMTGFDAPGETLSQVILCKFTMPRYNAQMKQKMVYWKSRGFPNYYQYMALEKFIQAAGRLIRSEECRGVFSLLDQAAMDSSSHVFKTAKMGIEQLGSPITQDLTEVERFINGSTV